MAKKPICEEVNTPAEAEIEPLASRLSETLTRFLKGEKEQASGLQRASREELMQSSPDTIEWYELGNVEDSQPGSFAELWERLRRAARNKLESGHRSADVVERVFKPMARAQFLALRESFIEDWQPRGSIEIRLVEMMAQVYTAYEFWMQMATQRAMVECQIETSRIQECGKWRAMTIHGNGEIEQAAAMADRYNRLFLRTLRQLRDLRRYHQPVIVQSARQINIAADGGKQINIQSKKKNVNSKSKAKSKRTNQSRNFR